MIFINDLQVIIENNLLDIFKVEAKLINLLFA